MEWPYSLNSNLNEEQQANRRRLLDAYGQFAQLSVLLLPLIYQLSLAVRLIVGRSLVRNPYKAVKDHQSPVSSTRRKQNGSSSKHGWGQLRWVSEGQIAQGWGTWKHWAMALAWTVWLLLLVVKDTGDDYLHVTKRFGIVAASQLPIHYLLAMKAWSPIQYITRMSHEEINPYHRLLGRIIVLLMVCHASLYLNFYVQKGLLFKRIQDRDVILGLCAISSAVILFTTALAIIRDHYYRLFFYLHVILSMTLLPILYFHVSHLRIYILEAAAVYILLILQRNFSQDSVQATITCLKGTDLLSISIPLTKSLARRTYAPGQHIYMSFPSLKDKLRINPFTIANLPQQDRKIQVIARALTGTTAMLNRLTQQPQPTPLLIEGPYGAAKNFPELENYDSVLLVAGGVGGTFTLPIYRRLLAQRDAKGGPKTLRCVWAVRAKEEAEWGRQYLVEEFGASPEGLEIFVTGQGGRGRSLKPPGGVEDEEIELQERQGLLDDSDGPTEDLDGIGKVEVRRARPHIGSLVDQTFAHDSGNRVAILVCGPTGMGAALRNEVGRWIATGKDIFWHNEEFGW